MAYLGLGIRTKKCDMRYAWKKLAFWMVIFGNFLSLGPVSVVVSGDPNRISYP